MHQHDRAQHLVVSEQIASGGVEAQNCQGIGDDGKRLAGIALEASIKPFFFPPEMRMNSSKSFLCLSSISRLPLALKCAPQRVRCFLTGQSGVTGCLDCKADGIAAIDLPGSYHLDQPARAPVRDLIALTLTRLGYGADDPAKLAPRMFRP
jgi:hypothetical protein